MHRQNRSAFYPPVFFQLEKFTLTWQTVSLPSPLRGLSKPRRIRRHDVKLDLSQETANRESKEEGPQDIALRTFFIVSSGLRWKRVLDIRHQKLRGW